MMSSTIFRGSARVSFLCHCISPLKEKESHKTRNTDITYRRINFKGMSLSHYVNNIYALQFLGVGCSSLVDKLTLKLMWDSKRCGDNEENFL